MRNKKTPVLMYGSLKDINKWQVFIKRVYEPDRLQVFCREP